MGKDMLPTPRKLIFATAICVGSIFSGSAAEASPILPGQTVLPDIFTYNIDASNVLGTLSGNFSATSGKKGSINGTYITEIVSDPTRGGLLDFIIQVTEN